MKVLVLLGRGMGDTHGEKARPIIELLGWKWVFVQKKRLEGVEFSPSELSLGSPPIYGKGERVPDRTDGRELREGTNSVKG